jgi:hypothetical protein
VRDALGRSGSDERPLPQYATLAGVYGVALAGFLVLARNRLPQRIGFGDIARVGLASYKLGRLIAKDEVTAFVRSPVTESDESGEEEPKGEGVQRILGELVTCPYCIGVWVAAGLTYGLVLWPRQTRVVTTIFGAQAVADFLNAGFVRLRAS